MILIVLWSLVVYAGTAAVLLWLFDRFVVPLRRRVALLLAIAPLLFTGKALLTGGILAPLDSAYQAEPLHSYSAEAGIVATNPLLVDVVSQMLPWRQAVREAVFQGRFPLWNPYVLAGEPLLGVQQPAVFHPTTWIGFLLPPPQAWTFDLTVRLLLALACAYAFFRGTGSSELAALLGAAGWAFSDFLLFYLGYPVTTSVAVFPLLLLGLSRLADSPGRRAIGLTAAALCLIVVAGHPETLLFQVAGAGVFFLYELAAAPGRRLRAIGGSLFAGAIALGLTAAALLPFLEVLPQTWQHAARQLFYAGADRSEDLLESARRAVPNLVPYAWGTLGKSRFLGRLILPAGYAGALLIPFACAGLASRSRRHWIYAALGLAGLALNARLAGLTDLVTSLPLFDIAVADYFVFLCVFAVAALAALGLDTLREGRGSALFAAGALLAALGIVLTAAFRAPGLQELGMSAGYLRWRVLLQILPVIAALVLVSLPGRLAGAIPLAALLVLFAAERRLEESDVYPTFPPRAFFPPLKVLDPIPRGEPARFAAIRYTFQPNIAAMYGIEDVRGYEAMIFGPLAETFPLWSTPLAGFYNRVDRPSSFLALMNVRYLLVPPGHPLPEGCREIARDRGSRLCEIEALPRAFAPRHLVWTSNPRLQIWLLGRIWDFARDGVAGDEKPGRLAWRENGEAEVRISAYGADRMTLVIDARSPAFIGTSIPGWHGWKLSIDGKRAPLLSFDRAFLGFEVPPGRHEAKLRYLPDGFVAGAAISLATAAVLVVGAFAARGVSARAAGF
jgi:Bacterial membrane protein YfhO